MMRVVLNKAKSEPKRLVLAEGDDKKMVQAAYQLVEQGIADPVLIGDHRQIQAITERLGLDFEADVLDPDKIDLSEYADRLYELRQREGITRREARELVRDGNYLGSAMVEMDDVDAMLTGLTHNYPVALRLPLQIVGTAPDVDYVAGI